MKNALIGAAMLLVGVALGQALKRAPEPVVPSPEAASAPAGESSEAKKLRELRDKLAAFSEHDLEDYVRLKSLEEKYKKADELVGKMILILLADVGVRVSMEQEKFAKAPRRPEPPPKPLPSPVAAKPPRNTIRDFAERRLRDPHIGNPERYLRDVKLEDFGDVLARSTVPSTGVPNLNGCFDGSAHLSNGRDWLFHLALALEAKAGGLFGHTLIVITENGQIVTEWEYQGQQEGLRRVPDSSAYILEASSMTYLQIYELSGGEALAANIYTKDAPGRFSYKGTTVLTRTACAK